MAGMTDGSRIAVTIGFAIAGVWCLWRCVDLARSRHLPDRIGYGAHALMSVSMIAMAWTPPWLVGWQMAVFTVACGWFALQAVDAPAMSLRLAGTGAPAIGAAAHGGPGGRLRCVHHAVLMAVMVWMFHAASLGSMTMSGTPSRRLIPMLAMAGSTYAFVVAGLFAIAALTPRSRSTGDDAIHAVMTAGTAVMLLSVA